MLMLLARELTLRTTALEQLGKKVVSPDSGPHRDGSVLPGGSCVSGKEGPSSLSGSRTASPSCLTKTLLVGKVLILTNPASYCTSHCGVPWFSQTDELRSLLQEVLFLLQSATMASRVVSLSKQAAFSRPFMAGFPSTFRCWVPTTEHT